MKRDLGKKWRRGPSAPRRTMWRNVARNACARLPSRTGKPRSATRSSAAGERLQDGDSVVGRDRIGEGAAVADGLCAHEDVDVASQPSRVVHDVRREAGMAT